MRRLSLELVPPMFPMALRMWYGIDIHHSVLSTPDRSSQRSSAPPVAHRANEVGETPVVVGIRSEGAISPTSDPSSTFDTERNTSDKLKKAWGVTWSGLQTALRLLEKSANAFPPLQSAVGGLVACLDLAQVGYSSQLHI